MPTWTTISRLRPGDQIAWHIGDRRPTGLDEPCDTWLTVRTTTVDGRSRVLTFTDGTTFDAGHAYRLWVKTP